MDTFYYFYRIIIILITIIINKDFTAENVPNCLLHRYAAEAKMADCYVDLFHQPASVESGHYIL